MTNVTRSALSLVALLAVNCGDVDSSDETVNICPMQQALFGGTVDDTHRAVVMVVSIQNGIRHSCSGTVISPGKVLTAAHCVCRSNPLAVPPTTALDCQAVPVYISTSESYDARGYDPDEIAWSGRAQVHPSRDLAVITLESATPPDIEAIAIATTPPVFGEPVTIVGWGVSDEEGFGTRREGEMEILGITPGIIYAISPLCAMTAVLIGHGDSGGPLLSWDGNIVGVVLGRKDSDNTVSFTNTTTYRQWILAQ